MPSHISRGKSRAALGISALATVLLALSQPACERLRKVEGASPRVAGEEAAQAGQASLFTVSADQRAHLKVVPVTRTRWSTTVHTTGTVDWDADHTTQAITQVSGPISRLLVDLGSQVKVDQPLLYVNSPDVANAISAYRKARNQLDWPSGRWTATRICWTHKALAAKIWKPPSRTTTTPIGCGEQPAGAQDFRRHAAGDGRCPAAGRRDQPGTGGALADRRRGGAETGFARAGDSGRRRPPASSISDVSTVWVQGHIYDRDLASVRSATRSRRPIRRLPDLSRRGFLHRSDGGSGDAHDSGPDRDAQPGRTAEEGHVRGRGDPHRIRKERSDGPDFRRAAQRGKPAFRVRGGRAGQVRAEAGEPGRAAGRRDGDRERAQGRGKDCRRRQRFLQFANSSAQEIPE